MTYNQTGPIRGRGGNIAFDWRSCTPGYSGTYVRWSLGLVLTPETGAAGPSVDAANLEEVEVFEEYTLTESALKGLMNALNEAERMYISGQSHRTQLSKQTATQQANHVGRTIKCEEKPPHIDIHRFSLRTRPSRQLRSHSTFHGNNRPVLEFLACHNHRSWSTIVPMKEIAKTSNIKTLATWNEAHVLITRYARQSLGMERWGYSRTTAFVRASKVSGTREIPLTAAGI